MKVPGMLSARSVRPAVVGATLKSIDKSSIKDIRTVHYGQEYWRR